MADFVKYALEGTWKGEAEVSSPGQPPVASQT